MQVAWLVILIPSLLLGAQLGGLPGIAIAQAAVAVLVVVPLYARLLRRVGITAATLFSRIWLPIVAALVVLVVAMATTLTSSALLAGAVSGATTLGVIGLLLWNSRELLSRFRTLRSNEGV